MDQMRAEILVEKKAMLGEGPVWNPIQHSLDYVDITECLIYRYDPWAKILTHKNMGDMVGCIVPAEGGGLVAAVRNKIILLDQDLAREKEIFRIPIPDHLRFNDGKCDAKGRLWAGVMAADQTHPKAVRGGALYCFEDGEEPVQVLDGLTIPNGLAWNQENTVLYFIDTAGGCVSGYEFDLDSGRLGGRCTVIEIPPEEGGPDGMCIDEEGRLWIAVWGGSKVVVYDPAGGNRLVEVPVPAKNVSCCSFGGEDGDELFITSAVDEEGNGGETFHVKTGIKGAAPFSFQMKSLAAER